MPSVHELARLNKLHYLGSSGKKGKARRKAERMGYNSEKLTRGVAHWKHRDGHSVISIKGTDPTNSRDLLSDASLAVGKLTGNAQLKHRKHDVKKIYANTTGDKYLTGHSLGGSIASKILADSKSVRDNTTEAHLFNTGHTKLFNKELGTGMKPETKKDLKDKVTQHHVSGDVISTALTSGSAVGTVEQHKATDGVAKHSLDNFT